jgi:prephenate dehydrogenase
VSVKTLGIFGVGAIGGSIGLRARRNGAYVVGADSDTAVLEVARNLGAIDAIAPPERLPKAAEVVVISTHLDVTLREIARLAAEKTSELALVIDVASVKLPVVRAARGLRAFVATHPLAGTHRSGVGAARADLFEGCAWGYVPSGDVELDERACSFIASLGGAPIAMSAEEHDRIVAITSHVPQVLAWRFARLLDDTPGARRLCGPVGRELLRIAAMSDSMWGAVLAANAANVERELRRLAAELSAAADEIGHGG